MSTPTDLSQTRIIEVFADVVCPFTHVGLRRLVERRQAARRDDVRLWVRAWPLELVNGAPVDAQLVDEEVRELRDQVAPDLFCGFRRSSFPRTSLPAMSLAAAAYEASPELGERVSLALRWALFEDGRDISDPAVLSEVARSSGVWASTESRLDAIIRDLHEGERRGVVGSPHFFVEGADFFCPSLAISRQGDQLKISLDDDGLRVFLVHCFDDRVVDDLQIGMQAG